jgi:hypothetical protein
MGGVGWQELGNAELIGMNGNYLSGIEELIKSCGTNAVSAMPGT